MLPAIPAGLMLQGRGVMCCWRGLSRNTICKTRAYKRPSALHTVTRFDPHPFLVSAIVRNDKRGFGLYLGGVAWLTALLGVAFVVLLALLTVARHVRQRPATH
jgi:hypothetical protein